MERGFINTAKAEQLFDENAALFELTEGMPESVAIQLLGAKAVDFARHYGPQPKTGKDLGTRYDGYGNGEYTAWYLTRRGFYTAVACYNVELIRELDEKNTKNNG